MQLFWTPASPFTRKLCVAARELDLWDHMDIRPTTWPLDWGYATVAFTPGLVEANPVARIPTLVTDAGDALCDSTLALMYLNERAGGGLIPQGEAQWAMWSMYGIADGIIEAQIGMRAELLRPKNEQSRGYLAKQRERIARCFDAIETHPDYLDRALDVAHITIAVACAYQSWRDWLSDFRTGRPKLAAWYEQIAQRPSMIATEPRDTPER